MVGMWSLQEADEGLGDEPQCRLEFGEELVGGEPYPGSSPGRFPDIGVSLFSCPVGVFHEHVLRPGEPNCFLCGKHVDSGRCFIRRRPWWNGGSPLDEQLEPDDGDYHDFPDHLKRWSSRTAWEYADLRSR
jgi:hypothetical protein